MELKVENENNYSASFLYLAIELNEGIAETNLFDKRDTFKFSVVRMPYKRSNIPQKYFKLPSALKFCEYVVQHQIMSFSWILPAN